MTEEQKNEKTEEQKTGSEEVLKESKSAKKEAIELPDFRSGDTVRVNYKITEGDKTRIQPFQGVVIACKGKGISKTFTVRKIAAGAIGVERIFPLYSPNISKVEVLKRGKVRRAKLYYLRERKGKLAMKVKEASKK